MPIFSSFIAETHSNVSPGFVDLLIRTRREELFTGLMRLHYPTGDDLVLAFVAGVEQQLYRYHENATEVVPRPAWHQLISSPHASVGLLELPLEALRVTRVAHEAPVSRVERLMLAPQDFLERTNKWLLEAEPSIVHVRGDGFERMSLFANRTNSAVESISFIDGGVQYSINNSLSAAAAPKNGLQVVRYVSSPTHAVWREYELRLAMNPYVKILMSRFSELAGRVLTERLCEQLTLWARGGGWNIVLTSDGVIDRAYFEALDAAVHAYADILCRFYEEAGPAVGPRMAESLPRDVLLKMDPTCRELLLQLLFTRQGSSGPLVRAE